MARSSVLCLLAAAAPLAVLAAGPTQVVVHYTGVPCELSVDFVSTSATGSVSAAGGAPVATTSFDYPTVGYMHQAVFSFPQCKQGTAYNYTVTSGDSASFSVTPVPARSPSEVFNVFGDFGLINDQVMAELKKEALAGTFDAVLHVGDWAYNFEDAASIVGNSFMSLVSDAYGATVPVMAADGNHEACPACAGVPELEHSKDNFTQYRARMHSLALGAGARSGTNSERYYSFSQGLTHFVVFSAEAYAYNSGAEFIANQLAFLKADLAAVNRKQTPWVVALVHKDWTMEAQAYQDIYPVLDAGKVDVLFCGHVHYYKRYVPYDAVTGKADTGSVSADKSTYTNPQYMVNIVTGAPGNREKESKCDQDTLAATCDEDYGFGFFQALNATVATWSFKSVVHNAGPASGYTDKLTLVQEAHLSM